LATLLSLKKTCSSSFSYEIHAILLHICLRLCEMLACFVDQWHKSVAIILRWMYNVFKFTDVGLSSGLESSLEDPRSSGYHELCSVQRLPFAWQGCIPRFGSCVPGKVPANRQSILWPLVCDDVHGCIAVWAIYYQTTTTRPRAFFQSLPWLCEIKQTILICADAANGIFEHTSSFVVCAVAIVLNLYPRGNDAHAACVQVLLGTDGSAREAQGRVAKLHRIEVAVSIPRKSPACILTYFSTKRHNIMYPGAHACA
jgi:hypothetical protein